MTVVDTSALIRSKMLVALAVFLGSVVGPNLGCAELIDQSPTAPHDSKEPAVAEGDYLAQ